MRKVLGTHMPLNIGEILKLEVGWLGDREAGGASSCLAVVEENPTLRKPATAHNGSLPGARVSDWRS